MQVLELPQNHLYSWDRYVLAHPRGLAYQLSHFSQAINRAYRFDIRYLAAVGSNGIKGVLALTALPGLTDVPNLPGQWISSPYCDASGLLADDPETEAALLDKSLSLAREKKAGRVEIRGVAPFAGLDPELTRYPGKVRMVLKLRSNPDNLLASLKAKVRSQVKKPLRDGLRFIMGGRELLPQFYRVYAENMRDLGSPPHALSWFREVLSAFANQAHIGIVRLPDQTLGAAGIILCHPRTVSIPWASSLRRHNRMNPNMLLYWRFIEFAARRGAVFFDFGRSTPGEGTYRFKAQWGALPASLHWAAFDSSRGRTGLLSVEQAGSASLARRTAEGLIAALPVSLAVGLGVVTRKYIPL